MVLDNSNIKLELTAGDAPSVTLDGTNGAKLKKGDTDGKVSLVVDLKGIPVDEKDWVFTRTDSGKTPLRDLGVLILYTLYL
jgi:hypothetical protein